MRPGRLTVAQLARRLGCTRRTALRRAWEWHREHGGLLERRRGGRTTTLWVVESKLRRLIAQDLELDPRAVSAIHSRIDRVEALAERAMQVASRR